MRVGPSEGLPSRVVPQALATFERQAQSAVEILDGVVAVGDKPASNTAGHAVLTLCASLHGEWIRHPPVRQRQRAHGTVVGTGPPYVTGCRAFVTIRPRPPGNPYGAAAIRSMEGDHTMMAVVFNQMLRARVASGGP